jgi:hypothetical protein
LTSDATRLKGVLNIGLTALLLGCVVVIVAAAVRRWTMSKPVNGSQADAELPVSAPGEVA